MRVTGVTDGMSQATLQTVQQSAQEIVEQYFRYGSAVVYEDEHAGWLRDYFTRKNVRILP